MGTAADGRSQVAGAGRLSRRHAGGVAVTLLILAGWFAAHPLGSTNTPPSLLCL